MTVAVDPDDFDDVAAKLLNDTAAALVDALAPLCRVAATMPDAGSLLHLAAQAQTLVRLVAYEAARLDGGSIDQAHAFASVQAARLTRPA